MWAHMCVCVSHLNQQRCASMRASQRIFIQGDAKPLHVRDVNPLKIPAKQAAKERLSCWCAWTTQTQTQADRHTDTDTQTQTYTQTQTHTDTLTTHFLFVVRSTILLSSTESLVKHGKGNSHGEPWGYETFLFSNPSCPLALPCPLVPAASKTPQPLLTCRCRWDMGCS